MSAFSYNTSNQIEENIRALFYRVKAVSKIPMTHEQFASLFIPAEHREMYREIATLARTESFCAGVAFVWGSTELRFQMGRHEGVAPLPIPRTLVVQHDAPQELVSDITAWVANGGDTCGEFGRVQALFNILNKTMTKGQIRFVWPSILTILSVNPILSETLKELQEVKVPTKQPELPRGLLAVCRKTAFAVATASLIPADVPLFEGGAGYIEAAPGRKYYEPGLGEFSGLT
jgi:hypothetical protein